MKPVWLCAISVILLTTSACTSLKGPPPPPRVTLTSSFQADLAGLAAQTDPDVRPTCADNILACGIVRVAQRSDTYRNRYQDLTGERDNANSVQAASTVALVGFEAFDAHADNVRAAAMLLGLSNIFSTRVNAAERTSILYQATLSMNCYADRAQIVWAAREGSSDNYTLLQTAIAAGSRARYALQLRLAQRNGQIAAQQTAMAAAEVGSDDHNAARDQIASYRVETGAIESLLSRADTELPLARASLSALSRFPIAFQTNWQASDGVIHSRLAAQMPDIGAIADAIQALQPQSDEAPPTAADSTPNGAAALDTGTAATADLLNNLDQALLNAAMARQSGLYDEMLSGLQTCSALAAG